MLDENIMDVNVQLCFYHFIFEKNKIIQCRVDIAVCLSYDMLKRYQLECLSRFIEMKFSPSPRQYRNIHVTMQILLANDDGIHAPGLWATQRELLRLGEVEVVAPAHEQSGVGHSVTYRSPLQVDELTSQDEHRGWAVHGSPADCVKLGILELCPKRPELIVSGINSGSNYGINVLYSGTVAAAIEGAFFGITSVAISLSMDSPADYEKTAVRSVSIISRLLKEIPEPGLLWSINFPRSDAEIKGVRFVSMCVNRHTETMERRIDPRGKPYFWSSLNPLENYAMDEGSDIHALAHGYVTVTPLKFDLTNFPVLDNLKQATWACD